MITENILRVKLEATSDGQFKTTLTDAAQGVGKVDEAQQAATTSATTNATATREEAAATTALGESAAEAEARIKAMVRASLERQQAEFSAASATERSAAANASATVGYERVVAAQNRAMHGATDMVRAEQQAAAAAANTAGLEKQRSELGKLLGSIDPTIAALEKLDAQQAKLDRFRAKGLLGTDDYKMFSAVIDQSRERIAAAGNAMHGFSINNANARRELGYITKDLATGQYGRLSQSVMTLAANTGVMGLAFTAAGLAIGVVGAGLAAVALGAASAYIEEQQLNQAVATTGNFAGTTAASVHALGDELQTVGTGSSRAREILRALAADGRVGADSFKALGAAAVSMADLTGASAEDAAKQVVQMFDGTTRGALKASEQYHFLTAAVVEQIDALEQAGDKQGAMRVAAEAFTDAVTPRIQTMTSQVYGLAAGWDHAKGSIKGTWEAFKDFVSTKVGTADLQTQLDAVNDRLNAPQSMVDKLFHSRADDFAERDRLQAQIAAQKRAADRAAHESEVNQAGAEGMAALNATLQAGRSNEQKRADELITLHRQANAAISSARLKDDEALVAQIRQKEAEAEKVINAKYDKKAPKAPHDREPDALRTFSGQVDALDRKTIQGDTDALTQYQQGIAKLAAEMDVYLSKGGDATKAAAEFNRGQQALQRTLDDNRKREMEGQHEYAAALEQTNLALQQSIDNQVARIGMGDQEYQRTQQITRAYRDEAEQLQKLALQRQAGEAGQKGGLSQSAYEADVQALQNATDRKVEILREGYRRMDEAQSDWLNGARAAWQDYAEQAKDRAGQAQRGITTLYGDAEDAAADWLKGGKLTFKSFEKDFEDMLAHMVAKALIAQATTALLNLFAPGAGTAASSSFGYFGGGYNSVTGEGGFNLATAGTGGHAEGGPIRGPGTGTSDSVLIRASNGEYMQTADAVNYYGERFMDDVRAKRLPRYAEGGPIGGSAGSGVGASAGGVVVNIYGAENGARTEQRDGADGRKYIDVFINAAAQDVARGGVLGQAIHASTGTRRPARSYATAGA